MASYIDTVAQLKAVHTATSSAMEHKTSGSVIRDKDKIPANLHAQ